MLKKQYRSRPDICRIYNNMFYQGLLETAPGAGIFPDKEYPKLLQSDVVFIDTANLLPLVGKSIKKSSSRCNTIHAATISALTHYLTDNDYAGEENIGIISPYNAQAKLIRDFLKTSSLESVRAETVHKFQGNEREVIIYDTTDSYGTAPGDFTTASHLADQGARLLNVALSRAQNKLIIIGNSDYILKTPALKNSFVRKLITIVLPNAIDASAIPTGETDIKPQKLSRAVVLSNEKESLDFLKNDLNKAKTSITIFAMYATKLKNDFWQDIFHEKNQLGVEIKVCLSRDTTKEKYYAKAFEEISQQTNISVSQLNHLPGTTCIIDNEILWHTCTNRYLKSPQKNQLYVRIESEEACRQMVSDLQHFRPPSWLLERFRKTNLAKVPASNDPKHSSNTVTLRKKTVQSVTSPVTKKKVDPAYPKCGSRMVVDYNQDGRFLRCSGFPCLYSSLSKK